MSFHEDGEKGTGTGQIRKIQSELREGMDLAKCRRCGCMKDALENLSHVLSSFQTEGESDLLKNIKGWSERMEPIKYECLGCAHCYAAEAINIFSQSYPDAPDTPSLSCDFRVRDQTWPSVPGEYFAFCDGPGCPVAVSTLSSVGLPKRLADARLKELCIVGKTETENIGIDKVIKNIITNPTIRFLLLAGRDTKGHYSGRTILSLWENGVDEGMKVVNSPGMRPFLRNVNREEVEAFRNQVQVIDMIGIEDLETIEGKIQEISKYESSSLGFKERKEEHKGIQTSTVPIIRAKESNEIKLDKAGYFVIIPNSEKGIVVVEYYSYSNTLLGAIEGIDAKSIYRTIIERGWITELSHAAYVGKELARAELSLKLGFRYIQDGA